MVTLTEQASELAPEGSVALETANEVGENLLMVPMKAAGLNVEISEGWVSSSYGKIAKKLA